MCFQLTWISYSLGLSVKLNYGEEQIVSYLPLSHIAAQIADIFMPIMYGATVWFAKPDALKVIVTEILKTLIAMSDIWSCTVGI